MRTGNRWITYSAEPCSCGSSASALCSADLDRGGTCKSSNSPTARFGEISVKARCPLSTLLSLKCWSTLKQTITFSGTTGSCWFRSAVLGGYVHHLLLPFKSSTLQYTVSSFSDAMLPFLLPVPMMPSFSTLQMLPQQFWQTFLPEPMNSPLSTELLHRQLWQPMKFGESLILHTPPSARNCRQLCWAIPNFSNQKTRWPWSELMGNGRLLEKPPLTLKTRIASADNSMWVLDGTNESWLTQGIQMGAASGTCSYHAAAPGDRLAPVANRWSKVCA